MHVIATAGHVDHGKSTLLRALTGMQPDRWAEERRRGMTIDLGYAWTTLPGGQVAAFVDVPGHERFVANMLAGVGPVPAVLMVVAADGGWAAQSEEHLAALAALGVGHGVLAVTRSDLANPDPALRDAAARMAAAGIRAEAVAVSGATGAGLDQLRAALARLAADLPAPDTGARTRLWVDRVFTIRGAGTVVTGTLGHGRLAAGATVSVSGREAGVRGLQALGRDVAEAAAVARVALNLRGVEVGEVRRGDVVLSSGDWLATCELDVAVRGTGGQRLARQLHLHVGSAAVPVVVRPLGETLARLRLDRPLYLQVGDRGLLRDPGRRRVVAGVTVLDPLPPPLRRRGAGTARAAELTAATPGHLGDEVARRRVVRRETLRRIGVGGIGVGGIGVGGIGVGGTGAAADRDSDGASSPEGVVESGGWVVADSQLTQWGDQLRAAVLHGGRRDLLSDGLAAAAAVTLLGLPDPALLSTVADRCGDLEQHGGRVRQVAVAPALDAGVATALAAVLARLAEHPFTAPDAGELAAAGLGARELGAAAAAGVVLRLPGDVVLRPTAVAQALAVLASLPAPFTVSAARQALGTSRRVALPLLEHLDRLQVTERLPDATRQLRPDAAP